MIKLKLSFRLIVTIASVVMALLFGLIRIADPEIVEVLRLKYFDVLQKNIQDLQMVKLIP